MRWKNSDIGPSNVLDTQPTIFDETVYVAGKVRENPHVSAVDAASGNTLWQTDLGSGVMFMPAVSDDGLFIRTHEKLHKLDRTDGSEIWSVPTGREKNAPTIVNGTVFGRWHSAIFAAWDATTGERVWEFDGPPGVDAARYSTAHRDGTLYLSTDEALIALDRDDGSVQWQQSATEVGKEIAETIRMPEFGECVVTDDSIYVGFDRGLLILERSGLTTRAYTQFRSRSDHDVTHAGRPGAPAVGENAVFVFTGASDIQAVSK